MEKMEEKRGGHYSQIDGDASELINKSMGDMRLGEESHMRTYTDTSVDMPSVMKIDENSTQMK